MWYLGLKGAKRELFLSYVEPTFESYGCKYNAVMGPFDTLKGALYAQAHGANNPHILSVEDAERIAHDSTNQAS